MLLGAGLLLTGADLFGYSHEVAVAVLFAGVVILGAVAIRVVHGLPPDSSPW